MSFVKETIDIKSTPEPSRRYVQWKEEDVGLLLSDLEQPGHYEKWKENKSGFSKRVAEQVFKNVMYHEAIKFKVRWLESRFKIWNEQLTSPEVINDEAAIQSIREKMFKEFIYYDRCKPIFLRQHHRQQQHHSPAYTSPVSAPLLIESGNITMEPESVNNNRPLSPIAMDHSNNSNKRVSNHSPSSTMTKKKKSPSTNGFYHQHQQQQQQQQYDNNSNSSNTTTITEERRNKQQMLELQLEYKKMDHQERMQEMKLEQLRLEIELEKLKRSNTNNTSLITMD